MIWYRVTWARWASCFRVGDVERDLQLLGEPELLRKRLDGGREALVAQHERLEVEREVAQRADRVALALEDLREHALRLLEAAGLDRGRDRVQHQRDPRQRLHRPVVEEEREPAALLLLGGDDEVGHPRTLGLALLRLGDGLLAAAPFALNEVDAERPGGDDRASQPSEREGFGVERQPGHADQGRHRQCDDERGCASR